MTFGKLNTSKLKYGNDLRLMLMKYSEEFSQDLQLLETWKVGKIT